MKALELPINSGRTYFNAAIPDLEICLGQLEKYDGVTNSNSHRKDDFCDALATLADATLPKTHEEVKAEDPKAAQQRREREEDEYRQAAMRDHHNRVFGGGAQPEVLTRTEWERRQRGAPQFPTEPAPQQQPAFVKPFPRGGGSSAQLPPNMRGNPKR